MLRNTAPIHGFGIDDTDEYTSVNGVHFKYYTAWCSMIRRCYSSSFLKKHQSYIGCTVCDEWKYLSNFKKWHYENYIDGFHLDKDILIEGNTVYSPETCRYVPPEINNSISNISSIKKSPRGFTIVFNKKQKTFKTVEEAQLWYSENKASTVKELALKSFLANSIKSDIYLALIKRRWYL